MKKILLFLIVIIGTLAACKKNKITYYPVHADLKAAFNFKPGTYWIYRDSISGRIDSFFVTSTSTFNDKFDEGALVENDNIYISQRNIYPPHTAADTGSWEFIYIGNEINVTYADAKVYTGKISYNPLTNYPFIDSLVIPVGGFFSAFGDTGTIINNYTQYSSNGQSFNNVEEVNHHTYLSEQINSPLTNPFSYNDWFYICPDVGLIKITQNHPQDSVYRVWELQRYKIVN